MLRVGDRPLRLLRAVRGHDAGRAARGRRVLRLRRHLRGQERRHVGGDGRRQGAPRARHRRRGAGRRRQLVPDAHRRACCRGSGPASASMHLAEILAATRRAPAEEAPMSADWSRARFVGMPAVPGRAPRAALADTQLRRNLAHATAHDPRQAGRASSPRSTTGRSCAWPGAAIKDATLRPPRRAPARSSRRADRRAAATVHWARDAAGGQRDRRRASRRRHGVDEVVKVKSMATQEIGLNEALAAAGHRRLGDRPGRADRAARRRPAQPHPGAGDPPQPRRDPRDLPAPDGRGRASGTRRPDRRAGRARRRPRGCTCGRSSCAPRSAVSGANFAVAETGTLVVVESEGNGRMCLTLPEMLITRRRHREGGADLGRTSTSSCSCCRARRPASG